MLLSRDEILSRIEAGLIKIDPFDPELLNPNSVDLRLDLEIWEYRPERIFELGKPSPIPDRIIREYPVMLEPGHFYLGSTLERTECHGLVPILWGKSSLARQSLEIHRTAGFGDLGFRGQWTLEISVLARVLIPRPRMRVCQIAFAEVRHPEDINLPNYAGRYQDQSGVTGAKGIR